MTQLAMFPVVSLTPLPPDAGGLAQANRLIAAWAHELGPVERPFRSEPWVLDIDGRPVSVAVSCSTVSETAAGFARTELVELARLCSAEPWANRVMLRLWREVAARRWRFDGNQAGPPPLAAVSYSKNARHAGELYRFDGWERYSTTAGDDCGPGATWSKKRPEGDPRNGKKTVWRFVWPAA